VYIAEASEITARYFHYLPRIINKHVSPLGKQLLFTAKSPKNSDTYSSAEGLCRLYIGSRITKISNLRRSRAEGFAYFQRRMRC